MSLATATKSNSPASALDQAFLSGGAEFRKEEVAASMGAAFLHKVGNLFDVAITCLKRHSTAGATALALLSVGEPESSSAAVVANMTTDAARIEAANAYAGKVVSINAAYPAGTNYAAGSISASATVVNNEWVLTSKHFINQYQSINSTFSVSTGSNVFTNPGVTLSVTSLVACPNPDIDLALLRIDGTIPNAVNASFASPITGELNYFVGYGITVDLSTNNQSYTGDRRLFTGVVSDEIVGSAVNSSLIFESDFNSLTTNTFAGKAWSFDSGGGVFNSLGQQTGTMLYQSGGFGYGVTGAQELYNPSVQSWISGTVPEPNTIAFLILGVGCVLLKRNRLQQKQL